MAADTDPTLTAEANVTFRRLKIVNTILALAVLVLLVQAAWQAMNTSALRAQLAQAERDLDTRVERMAAEKLKARREELVAAVQWLDDFYRAPEGLQRPDGLWRADLKKTDAEAIGVWVLDVYLQSRIGGASDAEARKTVEDAIRGSDEWKLKHPKG
jgi:hypothetical protein